VDGGQAAIIQGVEQSGSGLGSVSE